MPWDVFWWQWLKNKKNHDGFYLARLNEMKSGLISFNPPAPFTVAPFLVQWAGNITRHYYGVLSPLIKKTKLLSDLFQSKNVQNFCQQNIQQNRGMLYITYAWHPQRFS
ncbi:MAG: hypothetical protein ABIX01_07735 [Chitinophagaceae bacterium]